MSSFTNWVIDTFGEIIDSFFVSDLPNIELSDAELAESMECDAACSDIASKTRTKEKRTPIGKTVL